MGQEGGGVIMDTLFTHYSQYLIISHVKHPCSVPFKIPPKVREVDRFSFFKASESRPVSP